MPLRKNLNHNRYRIQKQKKRNLKPLGILFLVALLVVTVFSFLSKKEPKEVKSEEKQNVIERVASEVKEITTPAKPKKNPAELTTKIEDYLANQQGEYGYTIIELDDDEVITNRGDSRYVAASTVKVAVAAYVYKQIELGKIDPEKTLVYTSADYEAGTGSLQASAVGSKFKVSYLLDRMIKVSDNVATNILIRTYGRSNIQAYLNANGLSEINLVKNEVSPTVMAKLLSKIYNTEIVSVASRDALIGLMTGSLDATRIVAGVPTSVKVAHKIGTQVAAISDIGVVYLPDNNYILSVYSKKVVGEVDAKAVIKEISRLVYEYEAS